MSESDLISKTGSKTLIYSLIISLLYSGGYREAPVQRVQRGGVPEPTNVRHPGTEILSWNRLIRFRSSQFVPATR